MKMKTNPNDPPFYNATHDINEFPNIRRPILTTEGMTKRELFAIKALQGMLSSDMSTDRTKANKPAWAKAAIEFADALIRKLNEGKKENKND